MPRPQTMGGSAPELRIKTTLGVQPPCQGLTTPTLISRSGRKTYYYCHRDTLHHITKTQLLKREFLVYLRLKENLLRIPRLLNISSGGSSHTVRSGENTAAKAILALPA